MRFLCYDTGLATEHAVRLAKDGHQVKYFTPWNSNYPTFLDYAIGLGVEGLEKELHFFNHLDWADCICFFDTGTGDLATFLREKGYKVFGAGHQGEKLENHRYYSRWLQKELGLPTQETTRLKGTEELKKFLSKNDNVVVKHDIFRGDLETFYSSDIKHSEQVIEDFEAKVGPFRKDMMFMAEETLEGVEPGFDLFHNGKGWLKPYLYGYEFKSGYIGKISDTLPPVLKTVADGLDPYLQKIDYRGPFSSEILICKGVPYLIDYTARMPFPLSVAYTELIDNYSEVIYKTACGEAVNIKMRGKYIGLLPLFSDYGKYHWLPIQVKPEDRKYVKFQTVAKHEDIYYVVQGLNNVVNLVAVGESVEAVCKSLEENIDKVHGHDLDAMNATGALTKIQQTIKEGVKAGIPF